MINKIKHTISLLTQINKIETNINNKEADIKFISSSISIIAPVVMFYFLLYINADFLGYNKSLMATILFILNLLFGFGLNKLFIKKHSFFCKIFGQKKLFENKEALLNQVYDNSLIQNVIKEIYFISQHRDTNIQLEIQNIIFKIQKSYINKDEIELQEALIDIQTIYDNPFYQTYNTRFNEQYMNTDDINNISETENTLEKYL